MREDSPFGTNFPFGDDDPFGTDFPFGTDSPFGTDFPFGDGETGVITVVTEITSETGTKR